MAELIEATNLDTLFFLPVKDPHLKTTRAWSSVFFLDLTTFDFQYLCTYKRDTDIEQDLVPNDKWRFPKA